MQSPFDREILEEISREPVEVPPAVHQQLTELLERLPDRQQVRPIRHLPRRLSRVLTAAACFLLMTLVVLPNLSMTYASAMEQVPVLGAIVRVLTIREAQYDAGSRTLEAQVPQIEDSANPDAARLLNQDVEALTGDAIDRFYEELELFGDGSCGAMYLNYEVLTSTERWFTLKISVLEVAGSGNEQQYFYHIDRTRGQYVTFGDLFDARARAALSRLVEAQLEPPYWTEEEAGQPEFWLLDEDQPFYFREDGTLQLVYEEYEIGPGYLGCPEISLSPADYEAYL